MGDHRQAPEPEPLASRAHRDVPRSFDAGIVRDEMQVIAGELGCTAVRITGGDPARLTIAGELAVAAGLEVWFAPFPCELPAAELAAVFGDCADRAEHLRRSGARVVLVTGCELTLFASGFLPGASVFERIGRLGSGAPDLRAAFAALPGSLNEVLGTTAEAVRRRFAGAVSYASGMWEPVDWRPFDIVGVDAYRDAGNASTFGSQLRQARQPGKPLAITEFGCCTYAGAGDRGGMGWAIADDTAQPPRLDGDYKRDETEQVRYLEELHAVFTEAGADLAFWFTFAGYGYPHAADPRSDLDMASYGIVKMLPGGPGTGYRRLGWEPKLAFRALAALPPGPRTAP